MSRLYLYNIFHLNLAFSLIPEDDYPLIIEECYWPLLEIIEGGIPLGIEATAYTLKEIERRDPSFIKRLSELWMDGRCEFIGSGYSQIIMPLVPADVNNWNLEIGNRYYRKLLGRVPDIALVNEQTFSKGLVDIFKGAGYRAIVMDWSNCYRYNHYPREFMYYPQRAKGYSGDIDILWNHSIAFQKFQRCIHRELSLDEYTGFILSHYDGDCERAFVMYGNDAEVFGYRPGEGTRRDGEHNYMKEVFKRVAGDGRIGLVSPARVFELFSGEGVAYNELSLESPETPLVCKKQEKYNPIRWAVSGRDNVHINTACYSLYRNLKDLDGRIDDNALWNFREVLCELWGSDFRTNTIDEKFLRLRNLMGWMKVETERLLEGKTTNKGIKRMALCGQIVGSPSGIVVSERALPLTSHTTCIATGDSSAVLPIRGGLKVTTPQVDVEFIEDKGFSIRSLVFPQVSSIPLIGTLPHGYYEDIHLGADFFSGHLIHIARDGKKTTDLGRVSPVIDEEDGNIKITVQIPMDIGTLWKEYTISRIEPVLILTYRLKVDGLLASSLRLGIFTFISDAFRREHLWYETVNGGMVPERFYLSGHKVSHDEPVSQRVSASGCLGATEGWLRIGDEQKAVTIATNKALLYSVPLLHFREVDEKFFLRVYHSIGEIDDTAYWVWRGYNRITFRISAENIQSCGSEGGFYEYTGKES